MVLELAAEEEEALRVARLALAMACTTLLAILILVPVHPALHPLLLVGTNLLTLVLFARLSIHALQRAPALDEPHRVPGAAEAPGTEHVAWTVAKAGLALGVALGSVVVLVRAGEAFGAAVHLPIAVLSLVVLAGATSLPNTVVAYHLAHTARVTTCLEEILSSNSVKHRAGQRPATADLARRSARSAAAGAGCAAHGPPDPGDPGLRADTHDRSTPG
jgi:Ca2+/Na+ antiporter